MPDRAAASAAATLLTVVGGKAGDAAHLSTALEHYRRGQRLLGLGYPDSLMVLQDVFAAAAFRSQRVTVGQGGSDLGPSAVRGESRSHDSEPMPDLLTRSQAALRLRCSESTLKRRERSGELHPVRHGRVVRYRREDLDAFLEGR